MSSKATLYLAGPIQDCTNEEANDWRKEVGNELEPHNIIGVSPLRCEPLVGKRYSAQYADPRFGTPRAIRSKNFFDVKNCNLTLAYFPLQKGLWVSPDYINKPPTFRMPSLGTICEVSWAFALGKPPIIVTIDDRIRKHPVIDGQAGWLVDTLEEGIEIAVGILAGYHGGKNI